MRKLILVINEDCFFLSHRTRIAERAIMDGWDVSLVAKDTGYREKIEKMGVKFINLPVNPTGMNLREDFKTLRFLHNIIKNNSDAIIHFVGLKNMLWGGLASRVSKTKGIVYAVSGLGTLFGENRNKLVSNVVQRLLRIGLSKRNAAIIFQNRDDEKLFLDSDITKRQKVYYIKGSGVNLQEFHTASLSSEKPLKIIFTARMLREKGVEDLIKAAELLRHDYEGEIEFLLCGGLSSNPSALTSEDMQELTDGSYIKWLGHRKDISELLRQSGIMCYPSFYREGVPKSLIEALATGLPIVTTDSVGCRDTVKDGENGILVPTHNPAAIADALKTLIENPVLRRKMGKESRRIAERDYDVENVASVHLQIYDTLNSNSKP